MLVFAILDLGSSRFDSVIQMGSDADDGIHFGKRLLTYALSAITDLLAGAKTHLSRIGSLMFIAAVTSSRERFQSCERLFKDGAFRIWKKDCNVRGIMHDSVSFRRLLSLLRGCLAGNLNVALKCSNA
jgi:hypothetical protein